MPNLTNDVFEGEQSGFGTIPLMSIESPQVDGDPFVIKPMYPDVQECLKQMDQIRIIEPGDILEFNKQFPLKNTKEFVQSYANNPISQSDQ